MCYHGYDDPGCRNRANGSGLRKNVLDEDSFCYAWEQDRRRALVVEDSTNVVETLRRNSLLLQGQASRPRPRNSLLLQGQARPAGAGVESSSPGRGLYSRLLQTAAQLYPGVNFDTSQRGEQRPAVCREKRNADACWNAGCQWWPASLVDGMQETSEISVKIERDSCHPCVDNPLQGSLGSIARVLFLLVNIYEGSTIGFHPVTIFARHPILSFTFIISTSRVTRRGLLSSYIGILVVPHTTTIFSFHT